MNKENKTANGSKFRGTNCYTITAYSISTKSLRGICEQPALWAEGLGDHRNTVTPLIYFQKPKWIDKRSFVKIIKSIRLDLPEGFKIYHT